MHGSVWQTGLLAALLLPAGIAGEGEPRHYRVTTGDGAVLSLKRYPGGGAPVLLLHGFAANRRTYDLDRLRARDFEYWGLAEHLRRKGFDVWLLNFRGAGKGAERSELPPGRSGWTVDEHGVEDLPAALDFIDGRTRRRPLLVAHSMGGLVSLIYLEGARWKSASPEGREVILDGELAALRQARVRGAVLVAPALCMAWRDGKIPAWLALPVKTAPILRLDSMPDRFSLSRLVFRDPQRLRESRARRALDRFAGDRDWKFLDSFLDFGFGPARNRPAVLFMKVREGVLDDCSRQGLLQFADGIRAGSIRSFDTGRVDYPSHYHTVRCPFLVVMGERDRLIDGEVVRRRFVDRGRQTGSGHSELPDRRLVTVPGYGHADVLLGAHAPGDVYPIIESWLTLWAHD